MGTPNKASPAINSKLNADGALSSIPSSYGIRPATSFQRCLLHRLADRFGILREAGSLMDGSIRLVKQKESQIPKKLLLDHPSSMNIGHEGGIGRGEEPGITNGINAVAGQGPSYTIT